MICGLILAGGRSSRFGGEKAMAELGGRPLIAWAAEALAPAAPLAVSARNGSGAAAYASTHGCAVLADDPCGPQGPLAGIVAGLCWADALGAQWLCTAPCDTPFLPVDYVARLSAKASSGGAVARTTYGLQPLCALWPVGALVRIEAWRGRPAPRDLLVEIGATPVDFPDPAAFANLNTLADYAAAETTAARRLR